MDPTALEAAANRLASALEALDAALERRLEADRAAAALAEQIHALDADRSRLAAELDLAAARSRRLESTNQDIAGRLDTAMDTIRSVIAANEH
jgi:uncharacterized membrane protein YccC